MKIKKILLSLLFISTFAFLFGCFDVSDVQSIEFVTQPKLVYKVGETLDVQVRVTLTSGSSAIYNINDPILRIKGFDTTTSSGEAYRTLVVSYQSSSVSAMYKVIVADEDPYLQYFEGKTSEGVYQIKNAQQLSNIRYALDQKFILLNDIDLADIKWRPIGEIVYSDYIPNHSVKTTVISAFSGELNGNGNEIKNLFASDSNNPIWFVDPTYKFQEFSLFVAIQGANNDNRAVIKNLKVEINVETSSNTSVAGLAMQAYYANIENVEISGNVRTAGSIGGIFGTIGHIDIINCTNNANLTSIRSLANRPGGSFVFVGGIAIQSYGNWGITNIEGCINNGNLTHEYYSPTENEICDSIMGHILAQVTGGTAANCFVNLKNCSFNETTIIKGHVVDTIKSFEGIMQSGGTTYVNTPNFYKQLVGGPVYRLQIISQEGEILFSQDGGYIPSGN